jgi:hypothetical protein
LKEFRVLEKSLQPLLLTAPQHEEPAEPSSPKESAEAVERE